MKYRSLFCSTLLVSMSIFSGGVHQSAHAQKGVTLTPTGKWSIVDVLDQEDYESSYCVMAKQFDPGTIVSVAKNKRSELSLAMDFEGRSFSQDSVFQVTLDPGAGQQREYELTPASPQAFVVRFGEDETFMRALGKTGFLRTEIDGEGYNFNLSDIDKAKRNLERCLANLTVPEQEIPVAEVVEPVEAVEPMKLKADETFQVAYEAEIEELKQEMIVLGNENAKLQGMLEEARRPSSQEQEFETKLAEVAALNKQIEELEQMNSDLFDLEDKNGKLLSDFQKQIDLLQEENQTLKSDLAKKTQDAMSHNSKQDQLRKDIEKELNSHNAAIETLTKENESLKKELAEAKRAAPVRVESVDNGLVKALKQENEALREELKIAKSAAVHRQDDTKIKNLEATIAKLQMDLTERNAALLEYKSLEQENQKLKDENAEMKVKLGMIPETPDEIRKKFEKLANLEIEHQELLQQVSVMKEKEEKILNALAAVRRENEVLKGDLEEANLMQEDLRRQIAFTPPVTATPLEEPQEELQQAISHVQKEGHVVESKDDIIVSEALEEGSKEFDIAQAEYEEIEPHDVFNMIEDTDPRKNAVARPRPRNSVQSSAGSNEAKAQDIVVNAKAPEDQFDNLMEEENLTEAQKQDRLLARTLNSASEQQQTREEETEAFRAAEITPASNDNEMTLQPSDKQAYEGYYAPAVSVHNLLDAAKIAGDAHIDFVEKVSGSAKVAYQWQMQNVFGSAEQKEINNPEQFDQLVKEYLGRTESRCRGDFAIVPDQTIQMGQMRIDSYEIACVGNGANSSASLMFFSKGGTFTTLAHEAPTEALGAAMTLRDKALQAAKSS